MTMHELFEFGGALERQPPGEITLDDLVARDEVPVHRRGRGGDGGGGGEWQRSCAGATLGRGGRVAGAAGAGFGFGAAEAAARALVQAASPSADDGAGAGAGSRSRAREPRRVSPGLLGTGGAGRAVGTFAGGAFGALLSPERLLAAASLFAADLVAAAVREAVRMIGTRSSRGGSLAAAGEDAAAAAGGGVAGFATGGGGGEVSSSSTTAGSSRTSSSSAGGTTGAAAATGGAGIAVRAGFQHQHRRVDEGDARLRRVLRGRSARRPGCGRQRGRCGGRRRLRALCGCIQGLLDRQVGEWFKRRAGRGFHRWTYLSNRGP